MGEFGTGAAAALPGGIGVSLLTVYDVGAADGLAGGSPHVHLACSEGYCVVAGSGAVQTLNPRGFTETPLQTGAVVWFGPGTIHRLVNGGGLKILALMSNSGLPEAGDAVLTLPPEHLTDRETYLEVTTLTGEGEARTLSAMARRDLALEGFAVLRESFASARRVGPGRLLRGRGPDRPATAGRLAQALGAGRPPPRRRDRRRARRPGSRYGAPPADR